MRFRATGKFREKKIQPIVKPAPPPSPQKPPPPRPHTIHLPIPPRPAPLPSPVQTPARAPTPVRASPVIKLEQPSSSNAMKPPPSVKRSAQHPPEGSSPRPSKIIKLRVRTEKLRHWPRGRSGPAPARNPLPSSSRPAPSPSFRGPSAPPAHQRARDSPSWGGGSPKLREGTPGSHSATNNSSGTKMRVPLPSGTGRTPLPSTTATPKSNLENNTVAKGAPETPGVGADGQKKPSLKIKLSFGKKPGSATPTPQTPKPFDNRYDE